MKTIYLVRHAKSSWNDFDISDIDRPLNQRGKKDAPEMAKRLFDLIKESPRVVSSPAVRAYDTAIIFNEVMSCASVNINDRLYHASDLTILEVIRGLDDSTEDIMIFCHNPGITNFANQVPGVSIDNVPTCGILAISCNANNWQNVSFSSMALTFFLFPKMNGDA